MYVHKRPVPQTPALLGPYMDDELGNISRELQDAQEQVLLKVLNVAPTKPRAGMLVMADGTHWNPGSGAGVYAYRGGAWTFLG